VSNKVRSTTLKVALAPYSPKIHHHHEIANLIFFG